jgi:hypothetical protein
MVEALFGEPENTEWASLDVGLFVRQVRDCGKGDGGRGGGGRASGRESRGGEGLQALVREATNPKLALAREARGGGGGEGAGADAEAGKGGGSDHDDEDDDDDDELLDEKCFDTEDEGEGEGEGLDGGAGALGGAGLAQSQSQSEFLPRQDEAGLTEVRTSGQGCCGAEDTRLKEPERGERTQG